MLHEVFLGVDCIFKTGESSIVDGLEIPGFSREHYNPLPTVCTQEEIPATTSNSISEREPEKWPYLMDVKIAYLNTGIDL